MADVRMLIQISGTRDGKDWPAPGEVVEVSDEEAAALIAHNNAEAVEAAKPAKKAAAKVETADAPTQDDELR